ncbi:MAG: hypothetical protein CMJ19_13415 [Phycisphaeraceae bacterium]|nr:hypothetical protein [Phycisphaeraceae bacterium]
MKHLGQYIAKFVGALAVIACLPIALVHVSIEQLPNLIPDRWISPQGRNRLRAVIPWLWVAIFTLLAMWLFVGLQSSKSV